MTSAKLHTHSIRARSMGVPQGMRRAGAGSRRAIASQTHRRGTPTLVTPLPSFAA
jgi:hypothetical protein